jgi:hypothetical protein
MTDDAYLTPKELAHRWRLNHQTLANWRMAKAGPPYIKIGARVLYPKEGIQPFEKLNRCWLGDSQPSQQQT